MRLDPVAKESAVRKWTRTLLLGALLLAGTPAGAATEFVYDVEPNDRIQQAVLLSAPAHKNVVRIIGELQGKDRMRTTCRSTRRRPACAGTFASRAGPAR